MNQDLEYRDAFGRFVNGHQPTNGFTEGHDRNLGHKHSEETKNKMSKIKRAFYKKNGNIIGFQIDNNTWNHENAIGTQFKKGNIPWHTGKEAPWAKNLPQLFKKGQRPWSWKGGISKIRVRLWYSEKYKKWRSDIFARDGFICQECGLKGSYLEAHHIKQLSIIFEENNIKTYEEALECEEIWNINNGITLCKKCHNKTKKGYKHG